MQGINAKDMDLWCSGFGSGGGEFSSGDSIPQNRIAEARSLSTRATSI
jgi:hypothetical protein